MPHSTRSQHHNQLQDPATLHAERLQRLRMLLDQAAEALRKKVTPWNHGRWVGLAEASCALRDMSLPGALEALQRCAWLAAANAETAAVRHAAGEPLWLRPQCVTVHSYDDLYILWQGALKSYREALAFYHESPRPYHNRLAVVGAVMTQQHEEKETHDAPA